MVLIPTGIYRFLKAIDKENFDYFSGKDARGASVYMFDNSATGRTTRTTLLSNLSPSNLLPNSHMTMDRTMKKMISKRNSMIFKRETASSAFTGSYGLNGEISEEQADVDFESEHRKTGLWNSN